MLSRQQEQTLFNQNMAKPFTQIDLGNPLESLCMLKRAQVLNLMGPVDPHAPRGARFLELQSRFPQVVIELSADDGMLPALRANQEALSDALQALTLSSEDAPVHEALKNLLEAQQKALAMLAGRGGGGEEHEGEERREGAKHG